MAMIANNNGLYVLNSKGGIEQSVIADPYSVSKAYSKGDLVMNNGYLYSALSDMETGEWDASKWLKTNVGATIPTKTSDLTNDGDGNSPFFTNASNVWENITSMFIADSTLIKNGVVVLINRALLLLKITGDFAFNSEVSGYKDAYTLNDSIADFVIAQSCSCTAIAAASSSGDGSKFVCNAFLSSSRKTIGCWGISLDGTNNFGACTINIIAPIALKNS